MPTAPEIDWTAYNFPPYINVVHFSPSELDPPQRYVVRVQSAAWLLLTLALLMNLITAFVLAGTGMPDGGLHILYSALNLFLATVFCTWAVGSFAYKAIATSKSFRLRLWYWLWSGLTLLMLVPCLASFSNFNGWMRVLTLARWSLRPGDTTSWASRHPEMPQVWLAMSALEDVLWVCAILVSLWAISLAYRLRRDGPSALKGLKRKLKAAARSEGAV